MYSIQLQTAATAYRPRALVLVILRGRDLIYVCTASRGVVRGDPYLVGDRGEAQIYPFEPD